MERIGKILEGIGGRYAVEIKDPLSPLFGKTVSALPRGIFRKEGVSPTPGDDVLCEIPPLFEEDPVGFEALPPAKQKNSGAVIVKILPRKNLFIRPPVANLDYLFVMFASASPDPIPETVDKLTAIAEHHGVKPVIVITKCELNPDLARELAETYRLSTYPVFPLSAETGEGLKEFQTFLKEHLPGTTSAFAGASGIGKSTLINTVFPGFRLETGAISEKLERGRHTTRKATLLKITEIDSLSAENTYLADTPGFSMLDFLHFDFFDKEDLPYTFPEYREYLGFCRYTKCTHTKEEGCAILEAIEAGSLSRSRHSSYVALFEILKQKHKWDKPSASRKG